MPAPQNYSISHSELRPLVCGKAFRRPGEVSLHTPAPVGSGSHVPAVLWRFQDAGQLAQHVLDHLAGRNFLDRGETAGAPQNLLFLVPKLPLQMLLLPPRPPHPRSSSPETMDPPPPKAPPFPKTEGPSSTPSSAAGPRPPRLGRHLLIDANGVPYTYTVQLEEEPRAPPQREAPPGEPGPRKGYSCPECARVFASPLRLQSHRVSHSDLKPFTCGACGKAFKRSSHLSRHRATHRARAGPPHTCPLCPRRFQDAAELAQHVRLH
ncbi:zinc finger protein 580 isoform X3 [Balaenoptera acutorostrata]|uniref:Zinc finger protein 580 isoform X3 n=1 Tax=Balaenoptera acutorostrata TaxID=9767 RepID=A0ABM3SKX2_BALAC|nr:zinc finger protein 580 isoform X3 [Balaenoptera acutorostrata]